MDAYRLNQLTMTRKMSLLCNLKSTKLLGISSDIYRGVENAPVIHKISNGALNLKYCNVPKNCLNALQIANTSIMFRLVF